MTVRVTGGELRGRILQAPRGDAVRPTTDMAREAIFSILGPIEGLRVLDLYCGTGALGIEALSRGAATATLVDRATKSAAANVEAIGLADRVEVVRSDVIGHLRRADPGAFDLIFCDPPYRLADRLGAELEPLIERVIAPGGRLVVEASAGRPMQMSMPLMTEREYGDTLIRIHAPGEER